LNATDLVASYRLFACKTTFLYRYSILLWREYLLHCHDRSGGLILMYRANRTTSALRGYLRTCHSVPIEQKSIATAFAPLSRNQGLPANLLLLRAAVNARKMLQLSQKAVLCRSIPNTMHDTARHSWSMQYESCAPRDGLKSNFEEAISQ
jgi:hypothetical protein